MQYFFNTNKCSCKNTAYNHCFDGYLSTDVSRLFSCFWLKRHCRTLAAKQVFLIPGGNNITTRSDKKPSHTRLTTSTGLRPSSSDTRFRNILRLNVTKIPGNLGWEVSGETGIFPGSCAYTGRHPPKLKVPSHTSLRPSPFYPRSELHFAHWVLSCYSCGRASDVAGKVRESV